jgi:hypothetical protein
LDPALSALSLACQVAAREVLALEDEELARCYLEIAKDTEVERVNEQVA